MFTGIARKIWQSDGKEVMRCCDRIKRFFYFFFPTLQCPIKKIGRGN